jgi:hypothetical protein
MGGYSPKPSILNELKADYMSKGLPSGPNDKILDFDFSRASPVQGLPGLNVTMNDLVASVGSTTNTAIPDKLLQGMTVMGQKMIGYANSKGIDIAKSAEFIMFDISKDGQPDPKKVGAVLLAAASVTRVGGKGGHPAVAGANFDNNLSFKEFESLVAPAGFVAEHSPIVQDQRAIQSIADNIVKRSALTLAREAAQSAVDSGVQQSTGQPIIRCPQSLDQTQQKGCGR